jgi:protein-arginine deiminase
MILAICLLYGIAGVRQTNPAKPKYWFGRENRRADIILPNVDDDNGDGVPDALAAISSATQDPDILQVPVNPSASLPRGALVRVEIAEPWTRFARVFIRDTSRGVFQLLPGPVEVSSDETAGNGITVGLEALDFADAGRPPLLRLKLQFETKEGRPIQEENYAFTVAPFLVSCCLDPANSIHVVKTNLTQSFVKDLGPAVRATGVELRIVEDPELPDSDIWIQDAAEIGWATDGDRLMHVLLQGNRGRELDGLFAKKFLGRDSGVVQKGNYRGKSAEWIDWFGNLEASPPVKIKGREYKNGRIYAGTQGERSMHPAVITFLEAQGAQSPVLWIDTSWLVIGHVDETVSWVPSKVGTPYRMLIPSPRLAVEILKTAERGAPGGVLNRGTRREGDKPGEFERPLAEALADRDLMAAQEIVQSKIDSVRRTLQDGLGVADSDIIEIPVLFNSSPEWFPGRYFSETVNMVNSLLIGNELIVPDPLGPIVDGKDVLLQAVKDRLEPLGCRVRPVDNFYPYHRHGGEIHCGTNATRRPADLRAEGRDDGEGRTLTRPNGQR